MATLEKDNDYKDEYFDFMQYHLRKFCLECKTIYISWFFFSRMNSLLDEF